MSDGGRARQGRRKFWLFAMGGGALTVSFTAGVVLAVKLLLGDSLEHSASSLGLALIGLGPYLGVLRSRDVKKQRR